MGLDREDMVMGGMLLWCNPKLRENGPQLAPRCDMVGHPERAISHSARSAARGPEAYTEEIERIRWKEIQENNEKSCHGPERREYVLGVGGR